MGGQEKHVIKAAQTVEELNPLDAANAEAASAAAPEVRPHTVRCLRSPSAQPSWLSPIADWYAASSA